MEIKQVFAKDIDRNINGVVKVAQDEESVIEQELTEYVVTRELSQHLKDFFKAYSDSLGTSTSEIGVWITGFFGSGKSHFLKILSYLLSNRVVGGTPTIEYFADKVADPSVLEQMRRSTEVPTEAILFNIDSKASQWKEGAAAKTALLRAFARVFYEHLGFYGEDFKLAHLEMFVDAQGKTDEFREAFARVNGGDWVESRASYAFYEDDIVEVLGQVLGMSEESARRLFSSDADEVVAPDRLVTEIKEHVDRRAAESGGDFRLLFMVDEMGQFIGDDVDLMLNLQTLVEELGSKCRGRVWVMVTSQEAIDKVVDVVGNDFSKIQGRFNTRLALSSSSVDEVIKRRVLEKTSDAQALLEALYETKGSVLKNLFAFEGSQSDLIGYADAEDFQETYPFASYQFKLLPKVFNEIRRHGNAGKHLASGERSMLSGFQESAQRIEDRPTTALAPLWRFYDTLATSLDHEIRQAIDRAERAADQGQGLEPQDIPVLKTLYLIRYVKDVAPTVGNVAILLVDDIDADKVALRESVQGSLDRLVRQNYVARYGDAYSFLTDEEQDVEREIKATALDAANVIDQIKRIVFDGIYPKKKYRMGQSDFAFDGYVDDSLHGAPAGGMRLAIVTAANELSHADAAELALRSSEQAIVALRSDEDYYEVLANAARIRKYVQTQNISQLPESRQAIIRAKQKEAAAADKQAQALLEDAIVNAVCAVDGRVVDARASKADARLDAVLRELVGVAYAKAEYVGASVEGDADVKQVLLGTYQETLPGANDRALDEVERFLEVQAHTHQATSMGDMQRRYQQRPYGWREADIAAIVARLVIDQKATVERAGLTLAPSDPKVLSGLTKRSEWDGVQVRKRERLDEAQLNSARRLLKELVGGAAVPEDEDDLLAAIVKVVQGMSDRSKELLDREYAHGSYPGRDVVVRGINVTKGVLASQNDPIALLTAFRDAKDELLDFSEDFERVSGFFPNQQRLFDKAAALSALMEGEEPYLAGDEKALGALEQVRAILASPEPYGRIKELSTLSSTVEAAHDAVVSSARNDLFDFVEAALAAIDAQAKGKKDSDAIVSDAVRSLASKREAASSADTVVGLEALRNQVAKVRDDAMAAIDEADERARQPKATVTMPGAKDAPAKPVAPQCKVLRRDEVCPSVKLTTAEDVEGYVARIREHLLEAIDECGAVRLKG